MRFLIVAAVAGLSLSACATRQQAEGTAVGAVGGALVGGPVGAVVGAGAGAAVAAPGGVIDQTKPHHRPVRHVHHTTTTQRQ
jgi:outer membrane lipoprotein SlyB